MNITDDHLSLMEIFREAKLGVGHYMSTSQLIGAKIELERPLQDKFSSLLSDLVTAGYLESHPLGIALTVLGYQLIYGE